MKEKIKKILQVNGARFSCFDDFDKTVADIGDLFTIPVDQSEMEKTVLDMIHKEAKNGFNKNGGFRSLHEAYAVILEEFDELWDEIKINPNSERFSLYRIKQEAIQTAAMLLRLIIELT